MSCLLHVDLLRSHNVTPCRHAPHIMEEDQYDPSKDFDDAE